MVGICFFGDFFVSETSNSWTSSRVKHFRAIMLMIKYYVHAPTRESSKLHWLQAQKVEIKMSSVCFCVFSSIPGKLRQFVLDLHSGKLHREFHHGPDPTDSTPGQVSISILYRVLKSCFCFSYVRLDCLNLAHRRRREEMWQAAPQGAHSRSWRPARPATPSSDGTATSCDLNSLPVILWLNATPRGQGGG